jgi:riboflavin kinase/FMN adenylyltransferase
MIVYQGDPEGWETPPGGSAVAVGVFDGVHLGHLRVLEALAGADANLVRVAMTFSVHPAALLASDGPPSRLSTLKRRFELLEDAGIERVAVLRFDESMRTMTPEVFVRRFLVDGLNARYVAVGVDFRFGAAAAGTTETLIELGDRFGFDVAAVGIVSEHGSEIRSTAIRNAIESGDVARAAAMLGRPYEMEGIVVPGDGRGREIGVPTANVSFPAVLTVPERGVYAVVATIDGVNHAGVANLGIRPTFDATDEILEVHILDLDQDLYGKQITVGFVDRIRDERRFDSIADLVAQIHHDIGAAQDILANRTP